MLSNILEYKGSRDDDELSMPGYINLLIKTCSAFSTIANIFIINNIVINKFRAKDFLLFIPTIIYSTISIMSANRGNILMLILASFCAWYILYHRFHGWDRHMTWMVLSKGAKIAIVVFVLFWEFMVVVRNADLSNSYNGFMTYICAYFSGPLAGINMYIRQGGTTNPQWWGEETFVALNNNLNTLFGISHSSSRFLEYRSGFGFSVVNIYPSFRRFYHDFGFVGVSFLSIVIVQRYVTSRIYYLVKRSENAGIDVWLCVYAFFFYTVPYTLTDELFYASNISISGMIKLLILLVVYYFMTIGVLATSK